MTNYQCIIMAVVMVSSPVIDANSVALKIMNVKYAFVGMQVRR